MAIDLLVAAAVQGDVAPAAAPDQHRILRGDHALQLALLAELPDAQRPHLPTARGQRLAVFGCHVVAFADDARSVGAPSCWRRNKGGVYRDNPQNMSV